MKEIYPATHFLSFELVKQPDPFLPGRQAKLLAHLICGRPITGSCVPHTHTHTNQSTHFLQTSSWSKAGL